ncbi:MAG TPA: glucose 1-dehydrogenase [Dehalococcoidia bacterium]|nr:glucose 1-dehydrogenase [Dehalococcoidia bacterium]
MDDLRDLPQRLAGQVAIVTGAGRGIGRAYALRLAALGASVVVNDVNLKGAALVGEPEATTVELIEQLGRRSVGYEADISRREGAEGLAQAALAAFGRIDVLVNNAGIARATGQREDQIHYTTASRVSEQDWDKTFESNLRTTVLSCQAVVPTLIQQASGKIVNIASVAGITPSMPWLAAYAAAKAGVISYTKSLALELAPYGITVNAIAPGHIGSGARNQALSSLDEASVAMVPLGRLGRPEDCAKVCEFLATDLSSYVTGQTILVDGGMFELTPFIPARRRGA